MDGTRLHYVDRGTGTPLVLLHGNGSMIEDFQSSGLIDLTAKKYRVIAIDRPGFGHSNRRRSTVWAPETQADLIAAVLKKIGAPRAIILGHSWEHSGLSLSPCNIRNRSNREIPHSTLRYSWNWTHGASDRDAGSYEGDDMVAAQKHGAVTSAG